MSTASAPGSIANLGPGFDLLALAVSIRLEVEAEPAASWSVTSDGRPVAESTARLVQGVAGDQPHAIYIRSKIPVGKGLGSSAALRVAVRAAVDAAAGSYDLGSVFRAAAAAEGHPDNAAAAAYGGLVAVTATGEILRLGVHPSLRIMVGVPAEAMSTHTARAALDDTVPRAVAVRTAARVAALIEGLRTADPVALAAAAGDEIHELPRSELSPITAKLIEAARGAGALHAAWSGAGPSAVALATDSSARVVEQALRGAVGEDGEVLRLEIDRQGTVLS
ncbi:MAG: homoserine kinase [Acidimicrobiia bacterium]